MPRPATEVRMLEVRQLLAEKGHRIFAIGPDEPVQQPVVALRGVTRRVPLHAPLVFHANADVGEFLIGGEIAALRGELPFFVAHDVEHFLLHQNHALLLGDALARPLEHRVPPAQIASVQ